jgi:uncharacterized protein YcfL
MARLLYTLLPAILLALPACSSGPEVLTHDNGQIRLVIESDVDGVNVEDMKVRFENNRATAQFNIVNGDDDARRVFVSLEWLDAQNFLLEDSMEADPKEHTFSVRGNKRRTLTFFSPDGKKPTTLRCSLEEVNL